MPHSAVVLQWCRIGICASHNWGTYQPVYICEILFKLLTYHCIMFLASALHTTPDRHPYGVLLWSMRTIAVFGFCSDIFLLNLENRDLTGHLTIIDSNIN